LLYCINHLDKLGFYKRTIPTLRNSSRSTQAQPRLRHTHISASLAFCASFMKISEWFNLVAKIDVDFTNSLEIVSIFPLQPL
jgi:hypothetical protein